VDWAAWHERYAQPDSLQSRRLPVVQAHIRAFLAGRAAPARVISMCAGDGRDLLGVLEASPRSRVSARLVELAPDLAARARERALRAGLDGIEVVTGDAGVTDAYAGAVPADLVLACGVLGNVPDEDAERTVRSLPQLCAEGATVVWTRHRRSPDLTPQIRAWFAQAGFSELAFDSPGPDSFSVGVHRLDGPLLSLERGRRLFTFDRS
jgi:hypothetical protein